MATTTMEDTLPAIASPGRLFDLGPLERIPVGEGRTSVAGGKSIAVFRTRGGQLYATQAACPHRGGPLADGIVGGSTLVCPLHAFRFNLITGKPLDEGCEALQTFPISLNAAGHMLVQIPFQPDPKE